MISLTSLVASKHFSEAVEGCSVPAGLEATASPFSDRDLECVLLEGFDGGIFCEAGLVCVEDMKTSVFELEYQGKVDVISSGSSSKTMISLSVC